MRGLWLWLALLAGAPGFASEVHVEASRGRGWLTGAGLVLTGGGAVALSLAAIEGAKADSASRTVEAYYAHGAAPTAAEAATVRWMKERSDTASTQALALLISGASALAIGIGLVLWDGWLGHTSVSVGIQPSGASVLVTGRF